MANNAQRAPLSLGDAAYQPQTQISRQSRFSDDEWHFDTQIPGQHRSARCIKWKSWLGDCPQLTPAESGRLIDNCKSLVWSVRIVQSRRKRPSDTSLIRLATYLLLFVRWMIAQKIRSFRDVTPSVAIAYVEFARSQGGRHDQTITEDSIRKRLEPLVLMHLYRDNVVDGIQLAPFGSSKLSDVSGLPKTHRPIPSIPHDLLEPLLRGALEWVEWGRPIILVYERYLLEYETAIQRGNSEARAYNHARSLALAELGSHLLPVGCPSIIKARNIRQAFDLLVTACAIVTLAFTGMRISELLSCLEGCLFRLRHSNDFEYNYVRGSLFKTVDSVDGVASQWIIPDSVVDALRLAQDATRIGRKRSSRSEIFITPHDRHDSTYNIIGADSLTERINTFAALVGVPLHQGKRWTFSHHQFRKTFARYVALTEQGGSVALSVHFKHVSFAMTDVAYIGNDFELAEMIEEEKLEIMADMWSHVLEDPTHLAGEGGKRIQGTIFQGRAGIDIGKNQIKDMVTKLDKPLYALPHTYCSFEESTSACKGKRETGSSIFTCMKCPNSVVTEQHRSFWESMRDRNANLLTYEPGPLARASIIKAHSLALDVLSQLDVDGSANA